MPRRPRTLQQGGRVNGRVLLTVALVVQLVCSVFFVSDILMTLFNLRARPISWQARELMEIGATIGLVLGAAIGALFLRSSLRRTAAAEQKLKAASGAFMDLMEEKFSDWGLTPAERDVALFAVKGLSIGEIALLRQTSEGTVKAQTNAIYRKAGVSGRPQLLSLFIDDLLDVDDRLRIAAE